MPKRPRNYGDYKFKWDAAAHTITVEARYKNKNVTPPFGLGDATFTINPSTPPTTVTKKITGETTSEGFLPTSLFDKSQVETRVLGAKKTTVTLTGAKGWKHSFTFYEAVGTNLKEAGNDAPIHKHGWGSLILRTGEAIEW